jgi:hypothetical protein
VDDASPVARQDDEDEQDLEEHRGHEEEVHRDQRPDVVGEEGRPVCDGGVRRRTRYFETVAWEIWRPSFRSSP